MSTLDARCLYGRSRDNHAAVSPVRVATSHDTDGTTSPVYACASCAPPLTVARGGELEGRQ